MNIPSRHFLRSCFALGMFLALFLNSAHCFSQQQEVFSTKHYKGQFFVYAGWNWDRYTKSDIRFHGNGYDFKLSNVAAKDHQNPLGFDPYLSPGNLTIPQTNYRIGYYFAKNWSISIGLDHMKYVMIQDQSVPINGYIHNSGTAYDGTYSGTPIQLSEDFLQFEHTDGLNYINVELRRMDNLYNLKRLHLPNIDFNLTEGFGGGVLLPKTNTVLLGNERYDEFHLAGYGISAFAGINITFFDHFFIQSELKGGFINMPDIRTTQHASDRADQHFFFLQSNFLLGANLTLGKKSKKS